VIHMNMIVKRREFTPTRGSTDYFYELVSTGLTINMSRDEFIEFAKQVILEYMFLTEKRLM
jgi:hypothetical protein